MFYFSIVLNFINDWLTLFDIDKPKYTWKILSPKKVPVAFIDRCMPQELRPNMPTLP